MLNQVEKKTVFNEELSSLIKAEAAGYFLFDKAGNLCHSVGLVGEDGWTDDVVRSLPMLKYHLENPDAPGGFYRIANQQFFSEKEDKNNTIYIGPIQNGDKILGIIYDVAMPNFVLESMKSEIFILSLITQAVRAFNQAEDLHDILKIVLIGVTAGSGLGFNRAFILLTCDEQCCLQGTLANGPSSPEEAGIIWQKLSRGELTLEKMFADALKNKDWQPPLLNGSLRKIIIPLNDVNNIFARAALEKKSVIIDEITLVSKAYADLHSMIGPGPLAVVPLIGNEYLQGVLIADNFITRKEISRDDLHLLEIFARYASDSIEKFRLYERLEKKIGALKKANETIINSREAVIKAERLSVLAEMAGQVAHEIRNPLTIIGGFAKSMLKKTSSDNENHEYLNIIFDQVVRIGQTLEKFTSLMNYETKNDQVCELGELVKSALDVRSSGPTVSGFEFNCDQPVKVKIDPDLFRQALLIILKRANMLRRLHDPVLLSVKRSPEKAYVYFDSPNQNGQFAGSLYKSFHSGSNHELLKELSTSLEILKYYGGNIGIMADVEENKRFYLELPVYEEGE